MNDERDCDVQQRIDQLVDGELNRDQQRQLLFMCQEDSSKWRDVALAFIESQTLAQELPRLMDESRQRGAAGMQLPARNRTGERSDWAVSRPPVPPRSGNRLGNHWWSMALAVLLSIGLGFGLGLQRPGFSGFPGSMADHLGPRESLIVSGDQDSSERSTDDSILMLVGNGQQDGYRELQVPLVEGADIYHEMLRQSSKRSRDLLEHLQLDGRQIIQQRRLYPLELRDGRSVLVPVDDVRVQFTGYQ